VTVFPRPLRLTNFARSGIPIVPNLNAQPERRRQVMPLDYKAPEPKQIIVEPERMPAIVPMVQKIWICPEGSSRTDAREGWTDDSKPTCVWNDKRKGSE
jgi:hypothetical protein